jgi:hypothetical protein
MGLKYFKVIKTAGLRGKDKQKEQEKICVKGDKVAKV